MVREKFATQVDATLLKSVRDLAKAEGRQIQAVVEDALQQHLDAKSHSKGREHVMAAYLDSTKRFLGLYEKLARCPMAAFLMLRPERCNLRGCKAFKSAPVSDCDASG